VPIGTPHSVRSCLAWPAHVWAPESEELDA
jgi:hypothetical protein